MQSAKDCRKKEDETKANLNEGGWFTAQKVYREHLDQALTKAEWRDVFKNYPLFRVQSAACK